MLGVPVSEYRFDIDDIVANDWEVVPDKKTREKVIQESKDLQSYLDGLGSDYKWSVSSQVNRYIKNVIEYLEGERSS